MLIKMKMHIYSIKCIIIEEHLNKVWKLQKRYIARVSYFHDI